MWQEVLSGALPLALLFALVLRTILRSAPGWQPAPRPAVEDTRSLREQLHAIGLVLRKRSLLMLLLAAGLNGGAKAGCCCGSGVYLRETQGMGSAGIGMHVALLTGFGIVAGPLIGRLSDRMGRKPVIVGVLARKAVLATGMALTGEGLALTVLVALMGTVMSGANSLIQAGALDLADGRVSRARGLVHGSRSRTRRLAASSPCSTAKA